MPKNKIVNIIGVSGFVARVWGYLIWVLILILGISVVRNVVRAREIEGEVQKTQSRLDKVKEENAVLEAQIAQTQSQAFIEKEVRDKLGLVKAGEAIVILPDVDTLRKVAPIIPEEENVLPDPIWKRWLKMFL